MAVLARVRAPAHMFVGADGWYGQLAGLSRRLDALRATREDLPCGHDIHHAQPRAVIDFIRAEAWT